MVHINFIYSKQTVSLYCSIFNILHQGQQTFFTPAQFLSEQASLSSSLFQLMEWRNRGISTEENLLEKRPTNARCNKTIQGMYLSFPVAFLSFVFAEHRSQNIFCGRVHLGGMVREWHESSPTFSCSESKCVVTKAGAKQENKRMWQ